GDIQAKDFDALLADIAENGLRSPIILLPDNTILAGHQRVRVATKLGWKTIPAVVRHDLANDPDGAELVFLRDNSVRRQRTLLGQVRDAVREQELVYKRPIPSLGFYDKDAAKK